MKRMQFLVILLVGWQVTSAQSSVIMPAYGLNTGIMSESGLPSSYFFDYFRDDKLSKASGLNAYAGVEGSPFLFEKWAYARIKLNDGRNFDSIQVKLNLYENTVHFRDNEGRERMVAIPVKEIEIKDRLSTFNGITFVSGYGDDKKAFYQVISDGKKIGFMKNIKIIQKELKVFNAPPQRKFELLDGKLYLYSKGVLYEENKNCSLLAVFAADNKASKFIEEKDIRCNKENELKKLVEYYNSY